MKNMLVNTNEAMYPQGVVGQNRPVTTGIANRSSISFTQHMASLTNQQSTKHNPVGN